jgi:hypothetical protein
MKANPFCETDASIWLVYDEVPRVLDLLLEAATYAPKLYDILPWLKGMDVMLLCQERMADLLFSDASPSSQEVQITTFFAAVTKPIAEVTRKLYVSPFMRSVRTVTEILYRMAQSAGAGPLPRDVVTGICCSFYRQRTSVLSRGDPIQIQSTTWRLVCYPTAVHVRGVREIGTPFLILVIEETTERVLAFRCTDASPKRADLLFTLYDALVFSHPERWYLHPPTRLRVQHPLPPEIVRAGKAWRIEVEEIAPQNYPFLKQWEHELVGRVLDPIQYLRIFDRACERAFGYAPFLAKQQAVRQVGLHVFPSNDPARHVPSLREILPAYPATVGTDGVLEWQGWHYRDVEEDILRYWAHEVVTIRPSPSTEAAIWVYWQEEILCYATADELRHEDGSYRPYWFPYPRLGE